MDDRGVAPWAAVGSRVTFLFRWRGVEVDHGSGLVADAGSGGAHTSRTIMLRELTLLLATCPPGTPKQDYVAAILEDNVLSKRSNSTRHRSLRYLRELYVLDPASPVFRTLRDLWCLDPEAQPLLALECALARDPLLRATAPTVLALPEGAPVDAAMLAKSVTERYPNSYSPPVAEKIGRNTASSWTRRLQGLVGGGVPACHERLPSENRGMGAARTPGPLIDLSLAGRSPPQRGAAQCG
jgi:hypothetical protein